MSTRTLKHLLAPFTPALADPATTEIVVNRCGELGVEKGGGWSWSHDNRLTFDYLDAFGILAAFDANQDLSPSQPLCAASLPGGERLQVCRPSATAQGVVSLTIRKPGGKIGNIDDANFGALFSKTNTGKTRRSMSDDMLIEIYRRKSWVEFFRMAVRSRKTILVGGATHSGKTTALKKMMMEIPAHERIVTIEDTSEFAGAGPSNQVNLFYGDKQANLTAEDLVKASLRCRPDRIIMQEIRGAESFAFIRALAAGHPGGMTSIHAEEGHEFDALELMVKQSEAGRALPPDDLTRYLKQYIDITAYFAKDDDGYHATNVWFRAAEEAGI